MKRVVGLTAAKPSSSNLEQLTVVRRRFGSFRGRHDIRLAGGESNGGLLRGGPFDGASLPLDSVARCGASGSPVGVCVGVQLAEAGDVGLG